MRDETDNPDARIELLTAAGEPIGWTYDALQYRLVRQAVLDAYSALEESGANGNGVALQSIVAFVQDRLGSHAQFPSGRLTNATRYVAADLEGRGLFVRLPGRPVRLRTTPSPEPGSGTPRN